MTDILIASDAASIFEDLRAVTDGPDTTVRWVREGPDVRTSLNHKPADLAIVDMQIGTMGGVAVALDLRLEIDAGRLEPVPVILVLDRRADVFLARRSGVTGWLVKPLDPLRVRRAVRAVLAGETWFDTSYAPDPVAVPFGSDSIDLSGK
ncbi:MAG: response regulator [Actinomycetota bacterium]|nr:response regulator [Actinomycetota bacterium]